MSLIKDGEDPLAHLDADIASAKADAQANMNNSRDYWLARLSGLEHARELMVALLTRRPTQ